MKTASLPTVKTWRSRGMQVFCLKFPPALHSQEVTTTCNQLDGTNSSGGNYQAMGQQQYQKCIQPYPSLWESAVQLRWPATQYSKIINREPGEAELPRSGDVISHLSSLANWPYELGKVTPSTSLDPGYIIYKVRWLN